MEDGSGKTRGGYFKHVIFRANWEQLMMHQYPPGIVENEVNPFTKVDDHHATHSIPINLKKAALHSFDDLLTERGSYLHLVQQFYDEQK